VQRQTENAFRIAHFLDKHPAILRVNYPGLANFSGYEISKSQMEGFGAMLSFELDESKASATRFVQQIKLIKPAVSLGGVDTTICAPAVTSHAKMSAAERKRIGITDSLLRLSVGIEQVEDLIDDIEEALGPLDL
jgi:cystathionine beta-lyase